MPSSTSSSRIARALPAGLIAAVALFAASEHLIWNSRPWLELCSRYVPPYRAADPLRTMTQTRLLRPSAGRPPIVLVGSSQIQEGMDCAVFESLFPARPCVNLGVSAGTPLDTLYLADRIEPKAPSHTLVTGIFPETLHRGPKAAYTNLDTLDCFYESGSLSGLSATEWIDEILFGLVQQLSPTLRMKDSLLGLWRIVGEDLPAAWRLELPPQPRSALDSRPPQRRRFYRGHMGVVDPAIVPGRFTRVQEFALETLMTREWRRGNKMVVIDFPTRRGYETTITAEAVRHHEALIARLAARGRVYLMRREDMPPLDDRDFHDFTHLGRRGRLKVSRRVAEFLLEIGG
jgi:hypothetical protein